MSESRTLGLATLCAAAATIVVSTVAASTLTIAIIVLKPLTTVLVILHAARRSRGPAGRRVIFGLGASLLGDALLIWPDRFFVHGLGAFLIAHLAYISALRSLLATVEPAALAGVCGRERALIRLAPFVAVTAVGVVVLGGLWSGIPGSLRPPVVVYFAAIGMMAALATRLALALQALRPGQAEDGRAQLAPWCWVGGWCFVLSDGLIAQNMFGEPLDTQIRPVAVLGTYWLAQWGIATGFVGAERLREPVAKAV